MSDTFTPGDLVQVTQGDSAGKQGYIRECPTRASMEFGKWERVDEWGIERVYVVFDEVVGRWEHTCEHGSIRMSRKWGWPKKTDIVKVVGERV